MKTLTVRLPDEKHERLRRLARHREISMNKLVDELATAALTEFDAETRFRARTALGSPEVGLEPLGQGGPQGAHPPRSRVLILLSLLAEEHMLTATLTSRGQVTLPKAIRERLGVDSGDRVVFRVTEDGEVLLEAAAVDLRDLRGALKWEGPSMTVEEMEATVRREGTRL